MKKSEVLKYAMPLLKLTESNVRDVFNREFLKWKILKSDEVLFNGEPIDKFELALKIFGTDMGAKNLNGKLKYCNTIDGRPLTKKMFIDEQIKRYERVKPFTNGHPEFTAINDRIGLYLDHLHNELQNPHFEFVNNFDDVPESDVYDYFHKTLVSTNMLTEKEFHQYLKIAFEREGKLKKKFVLKNSKGKAHERTIFNRYSVNFARRRDGELPKYAGLLGDYFKGHDNNVTLYSNFNK